MPPKPHKYGARRVRIEGLPTFDSHGEYARYLNLRLQESAGLIRSLELKPPPVKIWPGVKWRLDFRYFDVGRGETVLEDFKGYRTTEFELKLAMYTYTGTLRLLVSERDGAVFRVVEDVTPKGFGQLIIDHREAA